MRAALFALAALVAGTALTTTVPVQAQESTRIIINKLPPRSYLDPGPVVKPGTSRDLNYVREVFSPYPRYGDDSTITGIRWPLPGAYDLPGY